MRISCPNCGAQYDVDPQMIPEAGRDVQCSNCAHTWFQTREATPPEADTAQEAQADQATETQDDDVPYAVPEDMPTDEELAEALAAEDAHGATGAWDATDRNDESADDTDAADRFRAAIDNVQEPVAETGPESSESFRETMRDAIDARGEIAPSETDVEEASDEAPADESSDAETDEDEDGYVATEERADAAEEVLEPGPRHGLDSETADILRAEAELEASRREAEAPPAFDPQGDLGLDEAQHSPSKQSRIERMRAEGVPPAALGAGAVAGAGDYRASGPRRERLPDIEEINSSLRPENTEEADEIPMSAGEVAELRRKGFRSGFIAVIAVIALAIGAYVYAPQIIRILPSTEASMIAYVDAANAVRDEIDGLMARAVAGLEAALGDGNV